MVASLLKKCFIKHMYQFWYHRQLSLFPPEVNSILQIGLHFSQSLQCYKQTWLSTGEITFFSKTSDKYKNASSVVSMKFQGHVEKRNSKLPHLQTSNFLICLHAIAFKSYRLSFKVLSFAFCGGNYQKLPSNSRSIYSFHIHLIA